MNSKFQWFLIAMSGAALAVPVQADPPNGNGGNRAPAARSAPPQNARASFRPAPVQNHGGAPRYSTGQRFSSMGRGSTFRPPTMQNYGGSNPRYSSGQRFSSMGRPDASWRQRFPASNVQSRSNTGPQSTFRQQSHLQSSNFQNRSNSGPITRNGFDRNRTGTQTGGLQNNRGDRPAQLSSVNSTSTTAQNHVFAQRSADWQPNWDRNSDHWWNGHRCRFVNNSWIIFDFGFYPWWPIGYPYDYYYGYDYYPYGYGDGYGYGYDQGYYGDGQYYGQGEYGQNGSDSSDQYGDSPVAAAQERLAREGYYRGRVDGVFGPETRRAVMAFQRDHGLNATGYLTRDTRSALGLG